MNKKSVSTIHISLFTITIILLTTFFSSFENKVNAATEASGNKMLLATPKNQIKKKLVYIVSDTRIPFWEIMSRGIKNRADSLGYEIEIFSAENSARRELEFTAKALKENVSGIIVSPTTSSACVTILKLAKKAGVPVVISDIGTDGGEYVSYVSSNNREGAYKIGKVLANKMHELGWKNGSVGIVAIPQKRLNGQARTAGFMQAMDEAGIKGADIRQQSTFSEEETYNLSKGIIDAHSDLRAIWLQGSDRYNGALRAITDAGKKNKILLITFDAEPIFLDLIPKGILVGSAMQQPYLMGEEAVQAMDRHLNGKAVEKNLKLPILAISTENIAEKLSIIKRNVLGVETQEIDVSH